MGAGASTDYASVAQALDDGHSQVNIERHLRSSCATEIDAMNKAFGTDEDLPATAVACEPTALYMIEQATLYDRFASTPEVLNKMRQRAAQTHKDGVYAKLPESGEEAPQVRAKNMRSSLVGGGGATLPTGFADTMLTLLSDVQRRLATIDHRLDAMERRIDGEVRAIMADYMPLEDRDAERGPGRPEGFELRGVGDVRERKREETR